MCMLGDGMAPKDQNIQAQALQDAAKNGTPFCESCAIAAAHAKKIDDNNSEKALYAIASGKAETIGDVHRAEGGVELGMIDLNYAGMDDDTPFGGSFKTTAMAAKAKGSLAVGQGVGATGEASAVMVEQGATGMIGNDVNNPWAEAGGEYSLLKAEAKGDALLGSDGKRAGIALGGSAKAETVSGDLKGAVNIPIPFTDWTIGAKAKGGGSLGSVGAGGHAHAIKDLETGRYHAGVGGEAAALLGLKFDLDLSVGPKYEKRK